VLTRKTRRQDDSAFRQREPHAQTNKLVDDNLPISHGRGPRAEHVAAIGAQLPRERFQ